jgi:hypothetical protein
MGQDAIECSRRPRCTVLPGLSACSVLEPRDDPADEAGASCQYVRVHASVSRLAAHRTCRGCVPRAPVWLQRRPEQFLHVYC